MKTSTKHERRWQSPASLIQDIREGFVELTRHSLALLGLALVALTLTFTTRPGLQSSASEWLMGWLTSRQEENLSEAVQQLLPEQAKVTHWLGRKYKVASQPLGTLVSEAWQLGQLSQVPPTLILAVMAAESGFNPFARGSQGAVGLMQITPAAESDALGRFGGKLAAFDPQTNLRVGARLLQASVQQAGSLEEGVRQYGRASGQTNEDAYVERVMAEHRQLQRIIQTQATTAQTAGGSARL